MQPVHDKNFRPDINGLRALAVLAVVLYHFDVPGFGGGFVGVDVFFVISGYLMTRIIVTGLLQGRFSTWGFYAARARRIVPALVVLCGVLLAYGWALMTPPDFERLGRHAAASIAFVSNIVYWRDVDYFGATKYDQWLLHTWSLSVEWQFYLLFPLVLMAVAAWRRQARALAWAMGAMLLVSFAMSVVLSHTHRIPAFYLLPTRAWEMLAGGLVFLAASRGSDRLRRCAGPAGLLLIVASVAVLREDQPWPGHLALWPVLGACLVIWGNLSHAAVLSNRVAQFLGDASYSIYLWHWPLVAALTLYVPQGSAAWCLAGLAGSILLGWVSLRFVETPTRRALGRLTLAGNALAFTAACGVAGLAAVGVWADRGLPDRENVRGFAAAAAQMRFANLGNGWCFVDNVDGQGSGTKDLTYRPAFSNCYVGDPDGHEVALLWGDSHAAHFSPYVSLFARERGVRVHELSTAACPPLFGSPDEGVNPDICARFQQEVAASVDRYRTIVIAGRWDYYMRHPGFRGYVADTLAKLTRGGARVILLGQSPLFHTGIGKQQVYATVFRRTLPERYPGSAGPDAANDVLREEAAKVRGVTYLEPTAGLCDAAGCRVQLDGVAAFYDANHLSIHGAEALAREAKARGMDLFAGS